VWKLTEETVAVTVLQWQEERDAAREKEEWKIKKIKTEKGQEERVQNRDKVTESESVCVCV